MAIIANKYKGIYAVAVENVYSAKKCRAINNANKDCELCVDQPDAFDADAIQQRWNSATTKDEYPSIASDQN